MAGDIHVLGASMVAAIKENGGSDKDARLA
jgi:hypothetical protein